MPWPRKTSTCRSFVTISSGLCRLFAIVVLLHGQNHTSRWTRSMGVDHCHAVEKGRFVVNPRLIPARTKTIRPAMTWTVAAVDTVVKLNAQRDHSPDAECE